MIQRLQLRSYLALSFLLLLGCKDIMHVQTGYVADRDECRAKSENNVGVYSQPDSYSLSSKDKNAALLQLFCECMKEKEWKVSGCPKPATSVAANPQTQAPTVVVVQSPTAQPALLQQAPPPAAAVATAPAKGKKAVCTPPGTCPAPASDYGSSTPPAQTDQQLNNILQRQ